MFFLWQIIGAVLLVLILLVAGILLAQSRGRTSGSKRVGSPKTATTAAPLLTVGIDDDSLNGVLQPFFCTGNYFYYGDGKMSFATFLGRHSADALFAPNNIKTTNVFGVGDPNGMGWLGGDSIASIELSNGDALFVYGDSFLGSMSEQSVWLASRREKPIYMPHNSVSYLKLHKDAFKKNKIAQHFFFIGQSIENVSNDSGFEFAADCIVDWKTEMLTKYKQLPYYFQPNGCGNLIQPRIEIKGSDSIAAWLMGGMCKENEIAVLASIVRGVKSLKAQFLVIKDALDANGLAKNPFLWDKDPTTRSFDIREELRSGGIVYQKIMKDRNGEYVVIGSKNKRPGVDIFLFRGSYDQILAQDNIRVWNNKWENIPRTRKNITMTPISVKDRLFQASYNSEFYFSKTLQTFCFFSISESVETDRKLIKRYKSISKNVEGPYEADATFFYEFPFWIQNLSKLIDVYSLRVHPGLVPIVEKQTGQNLDVVLSYTVQGLFPQYSGLLFDPVYSAYNIYYPQFIFIPAM